MRSSEFYLKVGQTIKPSLGFQALSVRVDNVSTGWGLIDGTIKIPAISLGGVYTLLPGTNTPTVTLSGVDPLGNAINDNGQAMHVVFYDEVIPPAAPATPFVTLNSAVNLGSTLADVRVISAGVATRVGDGTSGSVSLPATITNAPNVSSTDGALASIGATTDLATANTVIGRLKSILATLQAPLAVAGTLTDRSGSITTGGTAQTLIAANANRRYLLIKNPSTETENLFFSLTGTASLTGQNSGSYILQPGESFTMESNFVSTQAVSVIAATTGHKITASEG
jgi:hypothetical protein